MKWPLVGRSRFEMSLQLGVDLMKTMENMVSADRLEDAHRQIEWLQGELEKALEKRDRIDRVDAGLPENHREPPKKREPMPEKLTDYIGGFGSNNMKRQMRSVAYKRHADGETWDSIVDDVVIPEEPRERFLQAEEYVDEGQAEEAGGSEAGAVRASPGEDEPGDRS